MFLRGFCLFALVYLLISVLLFGWLRFELWTFIGAVFQYWLLGCVWMGVIVILLIVLFVLDFVLVFGCVCLFGYVCILWI